MISSYFLDSDVVLDFLLRREPFNSISKEIFQLALNRKVHIFVSSLAIANINYICTKAVGKEESLLLLEELILFIKILPVSEKEIFAAMKSGFSDFEDGIQYFTALQNPDIRGIITRNLSHYKKSKISVFSPGNFLSTFK